ncbi:MAG: dTDP-4-dehydrorhamnose reductase [Deltaproteobacteria bacterium RIFOXYA12_FULL_58_15]|nr:MAG: dTDP-4-dehydrorhamnose reductase [Deltaproteobacteria bacterium RIFOXYA12_FULL_58_15]OGR13721.1 MAG: dTDP-4-dehydrorhamnose reductase [Deltaproteobacteria bacterium RIFOXYB12_FULL_58_9]
MKKTIAVIGADGQLGTDLLAALEDASDQLVVPLTISDMNVCDFEQTRSTLMVNSPDIVINTAAFHRVDECETRSEDAFLTNAAAVHNLARVCKDMGSTLVHFSTDYVFDGAPDRALPFSEDDRPDPKSVYAISKLAGEYAVRTAWERHFVVRTCGLYGRAGAYQSNASRSFVETMLGLARSGKPLKVVNDQRLTPTATVDLAAKLVELIGTSAYGLYHITNTGSCTWYEFAVELFRLAGVKPDLQAVTSAQWNSPAKRPAYSVLRHDALRHAGLAPLRSWQEALASYIEGRQVDV